jgi:hypothetical protein
MIAILFGVTALAVITGTCLWLVHVLHRDGPTWSPDHLRGNTGNYPGQPADDGHEVTR